MPDKRITTHQRKRVNSFLPLIFILLALVACEPPQDMIELTRPVVVTVVGEVRETAVATQPLVTLTPEPTWLPLKEIEVKETAVPTSEAVVLETAVLPTLPNGFKQQAHLLSMSL